MFRRVPNITLSPRHFLSSDVIHSVIHSVCGCRDTSWLTVGKDSVAGTAFGRRVPNMSLTVALNLDPMLK